MALMRFCSSLPTILKFSRDLVISGFIMVKYWRGALEMFLEPFYKCSRWFTNVFIIALHPVTFITVDDSTSVFHGILVLGSHQEVFNCCTSLEIHLHPKLLHTFLKLSLSPLWYGTIMWGFWVVSVPGLFWLLLFFFLFGFLDLISILLRAHAGYSHLDRAVYRWSSSCFNSWGLEQMVLALCSRVPITLYFDGSVWWLSHCRYRSVFVGFLKTVLLRLPSSLGVTNTSRKGMDPSSLCSSQVNWICWSIELMWSRKALLCDDSVSSTNLFQRYGGCGAVPMAFSSTFSIYKLAAIGLMGEPMAAPFNLFKVLPLVGEIGALQAEF